MLVAPGVPKPNIEPSIREQEPRGFIFIIDNPSIRRVQEPMLQPYRFEPLSDGGVLLLYPEEGEQITILGLDDVLLGGVPKVLTVLEEV